MRPVLWYIQVLGFFGASFAGLFFLLVLGILGIFDSDTAIFLLGLFLCLAVSFVSQSPQARSQTMAEPVLLSFFFQGFTLFFMGFYEIADPSYWALAFSLIFFWLLSYFAFRNKIHQFLIPIFILGTLSSILVHYDRIAYFPILGLFLVSLLYLLYRMEEKNSDFRISITISFLFFYVFPFLKSDIPSLPGTILTYVSLWILFGFLLWDYLKDHTTKLYAILLGIGAGLMLIPTYTTPGILASVIVIFIAKTKKIPSFLPLGFLALVFYYSYLYYNMETTLLQKSLQMLGSSLLFWIGFFFHRLYAKRRTV